MTFEVILIWHDRAWHNLFIEEKKQLMKRNGPH